MNISKILNKGTLAGIIVGVIIVVLPGFVYYSVQAEKEQSTWLPINEIETKSTEFVNTELMQGKVSATVKVVGKEDGLYKLEVSYNGRKIDSFVSKDGRRFFPQSFEILKGNIATTDNSDKQVAAEILKTDKPAVELFVMSYCPYGTQIEKGILPAIEALGNKVDFKLKFVSYTMHGDKENQENLRQYCVDKEQRDRLFSYLKCFLKDSDSAGCLKSTGVDEGKLESCMDSIAKKFDVTGTNFAIHKTDNDKYGVGGSPTLVINGTQSQSGRDSKSLLKSICSAFNNPPKECSTELSSDTPAPGFGVGPAPSGSSDNGGCH